MGSDMKTPLAHLTWRRRPFTLVEVVVAGVITAGGLAAAITLVSFNLWTANFAEVRMLASEIAKNRLEQVRLLGFSDLPKLTESSVQVNGQGLPDANGQYHRTTTLAGPDANSCYWVTVTVTAPSGQGRPPAVVSMSTMVLDKDQVVMGG